jgi:DNA-directed RNA polymerase subunit RPC12/RpoP
MNAICYCCGKVIELDIDEFLEIDQEIEDYICEDCSGKLYNMIMEWEVKRN